MMEDLFNSNFISDLGDHKSIMGRYNRLSNSIVTEFLAILLKVSSRFNSDGERNELYCREFKLLFCITTPCECLVS